VPLLEPLYDGPYRVLTRSRDFFQLQIGGRTDTVSTSCLKPCLYLATTLVALPRHGRPPDQQREVTFRWPPVVPMLARFSALLAPTAVPAAPTGALAAAGLSTPPVLGAGTVFPDGQGFFACLDPGQEQRPSTLAGRPQRQGQPPAKLDL
jgi:hypothetical protein